VYVLLLMLPLRVLVSLRFVLSWCSCVSFVRVFSIGSRPFLTVVSATSPTVRTRDLCRRIPVPGAHSKSTSINFGKDLSVELSLAVHPERDASAHATGLRHVVSAPSSPRDTQTSPASPRLCPVDEVMFHLENVLRERSEGAKSEPVSSVPQAHCLMAQDQICRLRFYSTAEHAVHVFFGNRNVITGRDATPACTGSGVCV
jgi:hypothetical protein